MSFVWLRVQAALRHRWRALVVLAVVVGIGGGVAITALAGAQRTDTAVPQFVSYSLPDSGGFLYGNVVGVPPVTPGVAPGSLSLAPAEQHVVDLPQVAAYFRAPYLFFSQSRAGSDPQQLNVFGDADTDLYRSVDRPMVLAGRLPRPERPFEVAVNAMAASGQHLHVGSTVKLYAYSYAQIAGRAMINSGTPVRPTGPAYRMHVTGIVRFPQDVNAVSPLVDRQGVAYDGQRNLYTTPAFLQQLAKAFGVPVQQVPAINLVGVRLRHGAADWRAFAAAVPKVTHGAVIFASAGNVYGINRAAQSAQRGIHLDVVALIVFGLLVALITLLFVGQSIGRQVRNQRGDFAVLRSLGADRPQLVATEVAVSGLVGVAGALLAVVVAVAASPLMPVGLARQAEIHPGVSADPVFLVPGFFILALLVTLAALVPALRASRGVVAAKDDEPSTASASVLSGWFRGLSPVPAIGVRFGLEPRRGLAGTTASGVVSAVVAIATVAAALTFAASLNGLVASPRAQGWNWDALVGNPNDQIDHEKATAAQLARNPDVSGYAAFAIIAGASQGTAVIDGHVVSFLLALDPFKGSVHPTLVAGHAPQAPDQIVLASKTMQDLHRHLGETVHVPTPAGVLTLRVVGEMVAPSVGDVLTNGMGEGAWVYGPAVHHVLGAAAPQSTTQGLPPTVFDMFFVRYADGVSPAAGLASLQRQFGHDVLTHVPPADVINLQSVDQLPYVLTALVVALGIATVGNTLIVSVRRRRRDLAVLKTVGFVRRQVAGVVAWQASSIGLVALLIGIPVGIAAGRWAWDTVANGIGSAAPTVVPLLALAAVVPCVLLVANLIAAGPGWSAARVPPVTAMRAE